MGNQRTNTQQSRYGNYGRSYQMPQNDGINDDLIGDSDDCTMDGNGNSNGVLVHAPIFWRNLERPFANYRFYFHSIVQVF